MRMTARRRVGWLLRVNRCLSGRFGYERLGEFADALARAGHPRVAVSTVSRWESGAISLPPWVPGAYESLLGLRPGLLSATADTVYRYHVSPTDAGALWARCQPVDRDVLDELLERVLGADPVSGVEWNRLSARIAGEPGLVLAPARTWDLVSARLLTEMSVADGVEWMARAEAYHRLISHPRGQLHAIAAAAEAAADRSAQSMIGTLSVFTASAHADASRMVIRHITDPVTGRTFYGALLTSAKKLQYGHFDSKQVVTLLPVLADLLSSNCEEAGLASRLLAMVPAALRARLPRYLGSAISSHPEPVPGSVLRMCEAITAGNASIVVDPVLPPLVHEMLTDPVFDVRLCAMFLIYSSPYRSPVARALAGELLAGRRRRDDEHRMQRLLECLRVLGGPEERRLVEQLLLAPETTANIRDAAAYALGHVGGCTSDTFYRRAFALHVQRWRRHRDRRDASVLDRLVYAAGIAGRESPLRRVIVDAEQPSAVRAAATWWLNLPPHLRSTQDGKVGLSQT